MAKINKTEKIDRRRAEPFTVTFYYIATGEIIQSNTVRRPEAVEYLLQDFIGASWIEGRYNALQYTIDHATQKVVKRPTPKVHKHYDDDYIGKRLQAYPDPTEQLDAIWKGGQAMEDMRALIEAVKIKYPKPVDP